jgi:hypothetical protein
MPTEMNRSNDPTAENLKRQIPVYGWLVAIALALIAAGLVYYLRGRTHEHVAQDRYVGPSQCRQCHPRQYDSWKKTKMANCFDVLRPGAKAQEKKLAGLDPSVDYTHDAACLPCHTTGYGLVGGFVSIEKTPDLAGVTCESCHGHGGAYAGSVMDPKNPAFETSKARKAGLVYPPTENVCRECHNARSPFVGMEYKFNFDERKKLGSHENFALMYEHGK